MVFICFLLYGRRMYHFNNNNKQPSADRNKEYNSNNIVYLFFHNKN